MKLETFAELHNSLGNTFHSYMLGLISYLEIAKTPNIAAGIQSGD